MAYDEITALLGGWEGFEIVRVRRVDAAGRTSPSPCVTSSASAAISGSEWGNRAMGSSLLGERWMMDRTAWGAESRSF